jgi:hypothetical protein
MRLGLYRKSPEVGLWRVLEGRFAADVVGASMPVLRASNLALLVVGSLGVRDGDAQEMSKEGIWYPCTNHRKSRVETSFIPPPGYIPKSA